MQLNLGVKIRQLRHRLAVVYEATVVDASHGFDVDVETLALGGGGQAQRGLVSIAAVELSYERLKWRQK